MKALRMVDVIVAADQKLPVLLFTHVWELCALRKEGKKKKHDAKKKLPAVSELFARASGNELRIWSCRCLYTRILVLAHYDHRMPVPKVVVVMLLRLLLLLQQY